MAYKINNLPDYIDIPDGVATGKDIVNTYKLALQDAPEFYELEPAEVLSIILDDDDFSNAVSAYFCSSSSFSQIFDNSDV